MMPEEKTEPETFDDIAEELEQEEIEEMNKLAEELAKQEQKRREELLQFARETSLVDVIECIEKIKKFIEVQQEARDVVDELVSLMGLEEAEGQNPMLKALLRGFL